jgi:hypothetical protein
MKPVWRTSLGERCIGRGTPATGRASLAEVDEFEDDIF